jgi:ferredoxin-NADP reductase
MQRERRLAPPKVACHTSARLAILLMSTSSASSFQREPSLEREFYSARLTRKQCISEKAQTYHLEFVLDELDSFSFLPGQFISAVADDPAGKEQTRAYSIASAPEGNRFDLCLNRVEGGFFSNLLADLPDLPVGAGIQVYGPNGFFTLREPITDSILIATGTGIAPMRGFLQWLFPEGGPDRSNGKQIWLVYGTRYESEIYYRDEFEAYAARHDNFHYLPTLSRAPESWPGLRGYVQDHVGHIVERRAERLGQPLPAPPVDPGIPPAELRFDVNAYVCGLSNMINSVRDRLKSFGWHRKQIVFERYD